MQDSNTNTTMESPNVFRFRNINFIVGQGEKQKYLLRDVSGTVKGGHVLAVMGPSGAGKTTLISALSLDAHYGITTGSVTLNGVPLNDKLFKKHCYVVKQYDKHWPYLSCREALQYAAELYHVAAPSDIPQRVDDIIEKMGLNVCSETKCARLSGGQQRRLSIGMALLKQPKVLILDEPTSGLDAASAENIMLEIVRVAKAEKLIIMCSIHQPSSKVYNGFDQLMILSRGREAFSGDLKAAPGYFESIGCPVPSKMNPAEHYLDLVNADFSSEEEVTRLLDCWEERNPEMTASVSVHGGDEDEPEGVTGGRHRSFMAEVRIMFRRHGALIARDPVLYLGRCLMILVSNLIFAFVYWNAREYDQSQAVNKHFLNTWLAGVATNMGVVAVYALNDEFKSILREAKNGMINPLTYVTVKSIMVLPVIYIMSLFALAIPGLAVQDFQVSGFGQSTILWSILMLCFESLAECLAVWVDDAIFGMLQFMNFWFMCFLFCGNFLDQETLYYPFEAFYHILPFSYYMRSSTYITLHDAPWNNCTTGVASQAVCVADGDPIEVLDQLSNVYGVVDSEDSVGRDMAVIFAIGLVFKILFVAGVIVKTRKVAEIKNV